MILMNIGEVMLKVEVVVLGNVRMRKCSISNFLLIFDFDFFLRILQCFENLGCA